MMLKINKNRKGFTLVEIMIVVAIIALLAAIAVPNFLRARQRSQATRILDELRLIDAAIDQYAIENNKKKDDAVAWSDVQKYLKEGTGLQTRTDAEDAIGNPITIDTVGAGVKVSQDTVDEFGEVIDENFFGAYAPGSTGS